MSSAAYVRCFPDICSRSLGGLRSDTSPKSLRDLMRNSAVDSISPPPRPLGLLYQGLLFWRSLGRVSAVILYLSLGFPNLLAAIAVSNYETLFVILSSYIHW